MTVRHTIGELERALDLGVPKDIDEPSFISPMCMMRYLTSDSYVVMLGAQDDVPGSSSDVENTGRATLTFNGYWAVIAGQDK